MNPTQAKAIIGEIGSFSKKIEEVLGYLLQKSCDQEERMNKESVLRQQDIQKATLAMEGSLKEESERLKKVMDTDRRELRKSLITMEESAKEEREQCKDGLNELALALERERERTTKELKALKEASDKDKNEIKELGHKMGLVKQTEAKFVNPTVVCLEAMSNKLSQVNNKVEALDQDLGHAKVEWNKQCTEIKAKTCTDLLEFNGKVNLSRDEMKKGMRALEEELSSALTSTKKDLMDKLASEALDLRKKMEIETNAIMERSQNDRKTILGTFEEDSSNKRKELQKVKAQLTKDREEFNHRLENEASTAVRQLERDLVEISTVLKKEKSDREKEMKSIRDQMEEERHQLKLVLEKERLETGKQLTEEQESRQKLQKEWKKQDEIRLKERRDEVEDLITKIQREAQAREAETEEVLKTLKDDRMQFEERLMRERQMFKEALEMETSDLSRRLERINLERGSDCADLQTKVALLGKSASRHIDNLKHYVFRECQSLFDLATKPCSIVFNCFREEPYFNGGEAYLVFTGCTVNIGNGMNPKSGEFRCPEGGLYMFILTCCTFDKKKCLLAIRKNGKDVANLFDQDGDENKGKTMLCQTVLLELNTNDLVQVYAYTASGIFDHKNSHYTQFIGLLMRPSVDSMHEVVKRLGNTDLESNVDDCNSVYDDVSSVASTLRCSTINGGSRRDSRKGFGRTRSGPSGSSRSLRAGSAIRDELMDESRLASLAVPVGLYPRSRGQSLAKDDDELSIRSSVSNFSDALSRDGRSVTPKVVRPKMPREGPIQELTAKSLKHSSSNL